MSITALSKRVIELERENADLRNKLEDSRNHLEQWDKLRADLFEHPACEEVEKTNQEIADAEPAQIVKAWEDAREKQINTVRELRAELKQLRERRAEQLDSLSNTLIEVQKEKLSIQEKLEAAERERDEARQIISLSKGLRNDSNPIYAEVKELREQRDDLRNYIRNCENMLPSVEGRGNLLAVKITRLISEKDALAAALEKAPCKCRTRLIQKCPTCGGDVESTGHGPGWMNEEQWDAVKAGDWFCPNCPGDPKVGNGKKYWYDHDLAAEVVQKCEKCSLDLAAVLAEHDRAVRRKALEKFLPILLKAYPQYSARCSCEVCSKIRELRRMAEEQPS